jgi:SWI/SNF-related matrix-associated actin-dependent regulator of chromatin subfamily A-like protein 1
MANKPSWMQAALAEVAEDRAHSSNNIDFLEKYLVELPVDLQEQHPMFNLKKEGTRFGLASQGRILLGDEMGLGKTRQALVIAASFKEEWPILVVVPSALRYVWRDQALLWLPNHVQASQIQIVEKSKEAPAPTAQIVIVSYNLLVLNEQLHRTVGGTPYKVVIGDESHFIKSVVAKRTKAFLDIAWQASRCLLLSGTPLVNSAAGVYTQIVALLPQHPPDHQEFLKRYCEKKVECYGGAMGDQVAWCP